MRVLFLVSLFLFIGILSYAQGNSVNLLAQSPDGKTVKIVWSFKDVPQDIMGFDIKRKDGLGDWKLLNASPIMPGISLRKDLSPTGIDNIDANRIREKLRDMLASKTVTENNFGWFMRKWKNGDRSVMDVIALSRMDFDVSLFSGFGYVDRTVVQKMDYKYGLFKSGTDTLIAQISWNYGAIPDLNVIQEISSRVVPGSMRGVELIWEANSDGMKSGYVSGFNIYKRGIRLNERPVSSNDPNNPTQFSWTDVTAPTDVTDHYSISAESLFGIEGTIRSYTYEPSDHPAKYYEPEVTHLSSEGYFFKDGTSVKWTFPHNEERYIKGFYVEKENMPNGYIRVSELLPPSARSFLDKSGSQANYYLRVRVVAVYNDKSLIGGAPRLFNYFPSSEPPKPQNIRIENINVRGKDALRIVWDGPMTGDNVTAGYRIYQYDVLNDKFTLMADNIPVSDHEYLYSLGAARQKVYKYYVTGVSRTDNESMPGDVATWLPVQASVK